MMQDALPADAGDRRWMRCALRLAARGLGFTRPNPAVGAVLVRDGLRIGEGFHRRAGDAHAEVNALRSCHSSPHGATLYVTLEPCCTQGRTPPCTDQIAAAGLRRVVVAIPDPNPRHRNRGIDRLRQSGIEVVTGVCEDAARELIRPFAAWVTTGRPWVTLKMAMTLDGCIADRHHRSHWISGPDARKDVQSWRQRRDLVMVGVETALRDDPSLRCRRAPEPPTLRLIVDGAGRLPPTARVLNDGAADRTRIATTRGTPAAICHAWEARGAAVWRLPARRGHVALASLMERIGHEAVPGVLCEGGAGLAGALVRADLVDEYVFYMAPKLLSDSQARSVLGGDGRGYRVSAPAMLQIQEIRRMGEDIRVHALAQGRHFPGG